MWVGGFCGTPILLAHNLPYDKRMLSQSLAKVQEGIPEEWLLGDTLPLTRNLLPKLKSHSMANLCAQLKIPEPNHRALNDILALKEVLHKILGEKPDQIASSIIELWSICGR